MNAEWNKKKKFTSSITRSFEGYEPDEEDGQYSSKAGWEINTRATVKGHDVFIFIS